MYLQYNWARKYRRCTRARPPGERAAFPTWKCCAPMAAFPRRKCAPGGWYACIPTLAPFSVPAAAPLVSAQLVLQGNVARKGPHFHVGNARQPPHGISGMPSPPPKLYDGNII